MSHICIVVAGFYEDIAHELLSGACAGLEAAGATYDVVGVPGALEIPGAASMAIASKKYAGIVGLGCVIRGETTHYDTVAGESARGLNELAMFHSYPIGNGILTVENTEQAWARAHVEQGNKGLHAAAACMRMIAIKEQMKKS